MKIKLIKGILFLLFLELFSLFLGAPIYATPYFQSNPISGVIIKNVTGSNGAGNNTANLDLTLQNISSINRTYQVITSYCDWVDNYFFIGGPGQPPIDGQPPDGRCPDFKSGQGVVSTLLAGDSAHISQNQKIGGDGACGSAAVYVFSPSYSAYASNPSNASWAYGSAWKSYCPLIVGSVFNDQNYSGYWQSNDSVVSNITLNVNDTLGNIWYQSVGAYSSLDQVLSTLGPNGVTTNPATYTKSFEPPGTNIWLGWGAYGGHNHLIPGNYTVSVASPPPGLNLNSCSSIKLPTSPPSWLPNRYFWCNSGGTATLQQWNGSGTNFSAVANNGLLPLNYGSIFFMDFPYTNLPAPTPTTAPTATPTQAPWRAVQGGDSYQANIPNSISMVIPTPMYYMDNVTGVNQSAGVLYTPGSVNLAGNINKSTYVVSSMTPSFSNTYDYNYYSSKLLKENYNIANGNINPGHDTPDVSSSPIYYFQSDTSVVPPGVTISPVGGNGVIFLINGNLDIQGDLNLGSGKTVAYIVKGDVIIENGVHNVAGIFIVNGKFDTSRVASAVSPNPAVTIQGSVYANSFLDGSYSSTTAPTAQIVYRPDLILPLIQYVGRSQITWLEGGP